MENALCRRRRRDFHAFCVHSFWAGSCFVFKNLLVTRFSRALSAFQLCGSFRSFFSPPGGFIPVVSVSPLPTPPCCASIAVSCSPGRGWPWLSDPKGDGRNRSFQRTRWESQRPHSGAEQLAGAGWPSTRNGPSQGCGGEVGWYAGLEPCCRGHAVGQ